MSPATFAHRGRPIALVTAAPPIPRFLRILRRSSPRSPRATSGHVILFILLLIR
jgi:hypothetical protein